MTFDMTISTTCQKNLEKRLWRSFSTAIYLIILLKRNSFTDVFYKDLLLTSCILIDKT